MEELIDENFCYEDSFYNSLEQEVNLEEIKKKSYGRYTDILIESIMNDEANMWKEDIFYCQYCKYTSADLDVLRLHIQENHLDDENFSGLDSLTEDKGSLQEELKIFNDGVSPNSPSMRRCLHCSYTAHNRRAINLHMRRVHSFKNEDLLFQCSAQGCNFETSYKSEMTKHVKMVHVEKTSYECVQCDFTTVYKGSLSSHLRDVHLKNESFQCSFCLRKFFRKEKLIKHVDRFHLFQCGECDFKGKNREEILDHLKIHFFKCSICTFAGERKADLRIHFNTVHSEEKPYACAKCDFRTNYKYYLRTHIESSHLKNNPYKCTYCSYEAHHQSIITKHIRNVHLKIKKFECQECDFKASARSGLKKHVESVHERIRPYKCNECDFTSSYRHHIARHLKNIHLNVSEKNSEKIYLLPIFS